MSQADQPGGWSRRRFIQASAVGAAAAALPAGASGQDGNTTDPDSGGDSTDGTTYEPPDDFLGDAQQAIGADSMLIGALKYDESERTPDGFTGATLRVLEAYTHRTVDYYDSPTNLEDAAGNGILQIDRMQNASHHVLIGMFNEIQLAADKAWFDGMVEFLKKVDDGQDKATCVTATEDAGLESYGRVQSNLATFWKEQMNQLKAYVAYLEESFDWANHDQNLGSVLSVNARNISNTNGDSDDMFFTHGSSPWRFGEEDVDLVDGSTLTVPYLNVRIGREGGNNGKPHHMKINGYYQEEIKEYTDNTFASVQSPVPLVELPDGSVSNGILGYRHNNPTTKQELQDEATNAGEPISDAYEGLESSGTHLNMYHVLWDWIVQESSVIQSNLNEWANTMYGEIQAGEIDIAGIVEANPTLAASEFATEYSSTGHYSYVAASMASMGVAYDYEHEMHVQLHDGTELTGTMFVSQSDFSVEVGTTVNPDNLSDEGHVYFAYDAGSAQRELPTSEYQESVDGGVATLTTTPVEGTVYVLTTIEDETVEIQHDQWNPVDEQAATDPDATTDWEIDLSDELETVITSVESIVHRYPEGTGADLIRLQEPFKIVEAYNVETGEETDNVDGEQGTDISETDVQFTEEDLEAFREMVEAVKDDSDPPGGGGGGGIDVDLGGALPDWINPRNAIIAIAAIVGVNVATN